MMQDVPQHRVSATVGWLDSHYAIAMDDFGMMYFIYRNAIQSSGGRTFADLRVGRRVSLLPIQHPKGPRGIEVEILD